MPVSIMRNALIDRVSLAMSSFMRFVATNPYKLSFFLSDRIPVANVSTTGARHGIPWIPSGTGFAFVLVVVTFF